MAGSPLLARLPDQRFDGTISPLHATAHLSVPPCLFLHADTQVLANWTVMFSDLHEKHIPEIGTMAATSLQTFVKWGFWGWAVSTSWTRASLTKPCLLCQPQLYYQKWGSCQSAAIAPHSSRCNSLSLQPVSHTMEMYGQEIGIIAAYSHQHAFDSNLQEIRKSLR